MFRGSIASIGDYAFYGCSSLDSINLLSSGQITSNIGDCAFARSGVKKVKFGAKNASSQCVNLGTKIFEQCDRLKDVEFASTTSMGDSMFARCSSLTSVSFARTTQNLAQNAFENCSSLQRMSLPADTFFVPD